MASERRRGHTHSLKAIDETAIGTHCHLGHDVFKGDELPDVDGRFILKSVPCCGRVEVDYVGGAPGESEMGSE